MVQQTMTFSATLKTTTFQVNRCTNSTKRIPRVLLRHPVNSIPRVWTKRNNNLRTLCISSAVAPSAPAGPKDIDHVPLVLDELATKKKICIAQTAPAVRVALGEELGLPAGTSVTGKMITALRDLGFDYVFDVLPAADLTIMEEGTEFLHRLKDNLDHKPDAAPLPMFTSCCPGWIEFVEKCDPELIPNVSTCKSPHMMAGALIKNWYAETLGRKPEDVCLVSVMPCVRKQGEADRWFYHTTSGARDVDHVLTTKDLGAILRDRNVDFAALHSGEYDDFMGIGTGAAALFGTTGGVMEAALRTVYEVASGQKMDRPEYQAVRGLDGVKEATVVIPPNPTGPLRNEVPLEVNVAVANGLGNAKKLIKDVEDGTCKYQFIEVMACPGGCVGGGGQPRSKDKNIVQTRQNALYTVDEKSTLRRSHENPVVAKIYKEFLGEPGSHKAHELLHTEYVECGPAKFDITAPQAVPEEPEVCYASDVCEDDLSDGSSSSSAVDITNCYDVKSEYLP